MMEGDLMACLWRDVWDHDDGGEWRGSRVGRQGEGRRGLRRVVLGRKRDES